MHRCLKSLGYTQSENVHDTYIKVLHVLMGEVVLPTYKELSFLFEVLEVVVSIIWVVTRRMTTHTSSIMVSIVVSAWTIIAHFNFKVVNQRFLNLNYIL